MLRKPPSRIEMKLDEGLLKEHAQMMEKKYPSRTQPQNPFQTRDKRTIEQRIGITKQQKPGF